jgi:putative ABC transport system permease protein
MECFLLSMIGGLTGAVFGLALSFGLFKLLGTSFVFNGGAILLGVGFSAAVGIIFGWAPARKASKLNPIDALRAA